MSQQLIHAERRSEEPDPFRQLHLLPTAPRELVVEVYWHRVHQLQASSLEDPDLRSRLHKVNEAYSRILSPESSLVLDSRAEQASRETPIAKAPSPSSRPAESPRQESPWGLLHLDPGAPPDVVDLAYDFWRQRLRSVATDLGELKGAYEALGEMDRVRAGTSGDADDGALRRRSMPLAGLLVRWAKRLFGRKESTERPSEPANDPAGEAPPADLEEQTESLVSAWDVEEHEEPPALPDEALADAEPMLSTPEVVADTLESGPSVPGEETSEAAPPPDLDEQTEFWPLVSGIDEFDEPPGAPEGPVIGPADTAVLDDSQPATERLDSGSPAEPSAEFAQGTPAQHGTSEDAGLEPSKEATAVAQSEALAYLVGDGGPGGDVQAVIGSRPLAIGSDPDCGLAVRGLATNGGTVIARVWAHEERFMLHVLVKDPAVLVNGQTLVWSVLEDGDQLQIGDRTFRFERAATSGIS